MDTCRGAMSIYDQNVVKAILTVSEIDSARINHMPNCAYLYQNSKFPRITLPKTLNILQNT